MSELFWPIWIFLIVLINDHSVGLFSQLLKDMLSVSESTDWSVRSSIQSKYRALHCLIENLTETADPRENNYVKQLVLDSVLPG